MKLAYVDSSVITAIVFSEAPGAECTTQLRRFDEVIASPLLEAEVRSAARRESVEVSLDWFIAIQWVHTTRGLGAELDRILECGYLRGADCWHLATALSVTDQPAEMEFLTLDVRQREFARMLGFRVKTLPF